MDIFILDNQKEMKIQCGVQARLGFVGGELFALFGRKVIVEDFTLDVNNRKVVFYGTCSSSKTTLWRSFKSTFTFRNIVGGFVTIRTEVRRAGGQLKVEERSFKSAYAMFAPFDSDLSLWDGGYLDSSVDLDEYLNEDFNMFSDVNKLEVDLEADDLVMAQED